MGCLAVATVIFVQPMVFLFPVLVLLHHHSSPTANPEVSSDTKAPDSKKASDSSVVPSDSSETASLSLTMKQLLPSLEATGLYLLSVVTLLHVSWLAACQNWDFLQFYRFYYGMSDLTPNIGLFWNLFINVLKNYPAIFYFVFHTLLIFIPIPLTLKFR